MLIEQFMLSSSTFIGQHRPLTKIALENKIRAIISQIHPRQRRFAYETIVHPIERMMTDEYLSSTNKEQIECIYTEKKVIQWLNNLNNYSQFNDTID